MRLALAATAFAAFATSLVSQGADPSGPTGQVVAEETTTTTETTKTAIELRIATMAPSGTPWEELLKGYKKSVEAASKGRLLVKIFSGGTMGDENQTVRMLGRGQLEGVGASIGAFGSVIKELDAIEIPFTFKSAKQADFVLDKHLKEPVSKLFQAKGMVFGFWNENGFRHFGSTFGPVTKPEDLKSKKVRSQENATHIEMWKALGASLQAIPTPDVAAALKTGSVEGFDQSVMMTSAAGWASQIKYFTLSGHIYQPAAIAFNKAWFDKLPASLQTILMDEGDKIVRSGREAVRKMNASLVKSFAKKGITVTTLTDEEKAAFAKATAGVKAKMAARDSGTKALIEAIDKGVKAAK
jgi:TRAP-type C4-dicarboxylate transport system substrate-binding protein